MMPAICARAQSKFTAKFYSNAFSPEFPCSLSLVILMAAALGVIIAGKRKFGKEVSIG
jgi:hypothetical protein